MVDTGAQKSIIGTIGCKIFKVLDIWIDDQGFIMGISSKVRRLLYIINAMGELKNCLDRKRYLVIVRQVVLNPDSDDTLLAEYQIECYGLKVYSCPSLFGGKQLVNAKYQIWKPVKLGIIWD